MRKCACTTTLFTREDPNETDEGENFTANLNPRSLEVLSDARLEPSLRDAVEAAGISSSG